MVLTFSTELERNESKEEWVCSGLLAEVMFMAGVLTAASVGGVVLSLRSHVIKLADRPALPPIKISSSGDRLGCLRTTLPEMLALRFCRRMGELRRPKTDVDGGVARAYASPSPSEVSRPDRSLGEMQIPRDGRRESWPPLAVERPVRGEAMPDGTPERHPFVHSWARAAATVHRSCGLGFSICSSRSRAGADTQGGKSGGCSLRAELSLGKGSC
mmetsp:Transcript_35646/g.100373  ORF Transcript_35646/g.100373 Transcript_35646/m.100373 type:complete len:215 (+) Transcript_35646:783-1427(+)